MAELNSVSQKVDDANKDVIVYTQAQKDQDELPVNTEQNENGVIDTKDLGYGTVTSEDVKCTLEDEIKKVFNSFHIIEILINIYKF